MQENRFKRLLISVVRNRSTKFRVAMIACFFVAAAAITTFAGLAFNKEAITAPASKPPEAGAGNPMPARTPAARAAAPQSSDVKVALITVRPTGFEPQEITRSRDPFLLAVENRSGLQTMQLRLDPVASGSRLMDMAVSKSKHDLGQPLELAPGTYILSEAYHPEWQCTVTILDTTGEIVDEN